MNNEATFISIVIPTLGRASLDRTLESVLRQDANFEVIVSIDPAARDLAPREYSSKVMSVSSPGPGANRARNEGARHARGQIIWFIDDDTEIIGDDALQALRSIFNDPAVIAAGGEYRSNDSCTFSQRGYNAFCGVWRSSAGHEDREILLGGTLAVRKSAYMAAGGFDDKIIYGGAETSFVVRLNEQATAEQKIIFDSRLDVMHRPTPRGLRGWARVAMAQGKRKSETAHALPGLVRRSQRAMKVLSRLEPRTLVSLAVFGIPFIVVSRWTARWRR